MITKKKQPITGTNTAMKAKPAVRTNANQPSTDAMKQIKQPPQPFANKLGTAKLPTADQFESQGTDYQVEPGPVHKLRPGMGTIAPPGRQAIGQKRPINQSGQVNGPRGTSFPRKVGSQNLGKAKRHASFYGDN